MAIQRRFLPALVALAFGISTPVLALISTIPVGLMGQVPWLHLGQAGLFGGGALGSAGALVLFVTLTVLRRPAKPTGLDQRWWAGGTLAGATTGLLVYAGFFIAGAAFAGPNAIDAGAWFLSFGWLATLVGAFVGLLLGFVLMLLVRVRPGQPRWALACALLVGAIGTPAVLWVLVSFPAFRSGYDATTGLMVTASGAVAGVVLGLGLTCRPTQRAT